ncbi:MAG TPA: hypothetical protein VFI38_11900 [Candidatus Acidoferrum sp.]|nr:hypothetical protein [Candidatus Acidoferrum sp.]
MNCCAELAVITLESRDLCLEHFLGCSYERLDKLEPRIRRRALEEPEIPAVAAFLFECSNRALFISLQHQQLSNLDRSRLLNILLLSGDLQCLLDKPLLSNENPVSHRSRAAALLEADPVPGRND